MAMTVIASILAFLQGLALLPVLGGSVFSLLCVAAAWRLRRQHRQPSAPFTPPASVLKPVYGLDRELEANLRSFCQQDYPDYEVILSLQRHDDPARPILEALARDYPDRVKLAVEESPPALNGKVQNMVIGYRAAAHDLLVISDSDTRVPADYLRRIVAPLADQEVGYVCTLYRIVRPRNLAETLELLTINADFVPSILFTDWTKAAVFCLGASIALRRDDLEAIGGLAPLAEYLVEDQEMGRRLIAQGKTMRLLPLAVDMLPDYAGLRDWWRHVVYWDQNTKAAHKPGFAATVLIRAVPFAAIYWAASGFALAGLAVLAAAVLVRLAGAAGIALLLGDRASLRHLWLLPLRDVLGLGSWAAALAKRRFVWRGHEFDLSPEGRIMPRSGADG